ncbi:putative salivary sulfotransferase [Ixodes scapularis]
MDDSKRFPAAQVLDGDICPTYYDPYFYRRAKEFVPKQGDIIQVSFPRSGTHLMQQLLQLIVNGGRSPATFAEFTKTFPCLELHTVEESVSPRLIRTHLSMDKIRLSDNAKYVYVARNPWDCCVSSFHIMRELPVFEFVDASFDEFVEAFLCGRCGFGDYFDHVLSGFNLKDRPNVLFLTYEEILSNKRDVILKLARFLGGNYWAILRDNEQVLKQLEPKGAPPWRPVTSTAPPVSEIHQGQRDQVPDLVVAGPGKQGVQNPVQGTQTPVLGWIPMDRHPPCHLEVEQCALLQRCLSSATGWPPSARIMNPSLSHGWGGPLPGQLR